LKSYNKGLVAVGIGLILVSFLFVFPYVGSILNKPFEGVPVSPINITGIAPQDPRNLFFFAILSLSGAGLLVKTFI
jgi:hypothetical protein